MQRLPHRYPFLLIDRVLDFEAGKSLTAIKNVTINEPMFQGHFPQAPIFPGVLIIESMAQAVGAFTCMTVERTSAEDTLPILAKVDKARFRRQVVPGDQMILKVEILTNKRNFWKFKAKALVEDKEAAAAEIMCVESAIA